MTKPTGEPDKTFFDEVADNPGAAATKPKRGKRRRLLIAVLASLGIIVLVVGGVAAWYGSSVNDALKSIKRAPNLLPTDGKRPQPVPTPAGQQTAPMNIILMGSDSRGAGDRGRSDVLMLLHIPADRKAAYLISIPRDYWVNIPGRGRAKINAAYAWGGPSLTVSTVEQLLDVPIDHVGLIDFEGFMRLIDEVGGVTVVNKYASKNGRHVYPKGEITLTGESALMYVRERYDLPNGDFDRAERQRDVLKAIVGKLMSRGVLTSPGTFRDAIISLGRNLTVDEKLTNDAILDIGMSMRLGGAGDIKSFMVPLGQFGTSSDGQWYVAVDETKLADLKKALREDTVEAYLSKIRAR